MCRISSFFYLDFARLHARVLSSFTKKNWNHIYYKKRNISLGGKCFKNYFRLAIFVQSLYIRRILKIPTLSIHFWEVQTFFYSEAKGRRRLCVVSKFKRGKLFFKHGPTLKTRGPSPQFETPPPSQFVPVATPFCDE